MKNASFFLLLLCQFHLDELNAQTNAQIKYVSLTANQWNDKAFEHKAFIENKGQFTGEHNQPDKNILYAVDQEGIQIYFTTRGLTYRHDEFKAREKKVREEKEWEEDAGEEIKGEIIPHLFHMEWQNANPDVNIIAEKKSSHYFTYGDFSDTSHAQTIIANSFKKITYKNLYPGVDVEYVLPEKGGIKYSLVVHPGADASVIQMKYAGVDKIVKDSEGNIHLSTGFGEVIEHAPQTFYNSDKTPIESSFVIHGNDVMFDVSSYDKTKEIIIDPWVTNPAFAFLNKAFDLGTDALGNIYICGSDNKCKIQKLNSAGVPQWTYVSPWSLVSNWYGDFVVDPAGNSYFSNASGGHILKINTTGTLAWNSGTISYPMVFNEIFAMRFNVALNRLTVTGGCGRESIATINPATGAISGATAITGNLTTGTSGPEMRSMALSPNGNYYTIACNQFPKIGTVRGISPAHTQVFTAVNNGYPSSFNYWDNLYKTPSGLPAALNAIAASWCNIYTCEGATLIKRNISNGAFISSVAVFSGLNSRNSGIALDSCENVYVGTQNGINIYDKNLNYLTSVSTPAAVYDVGINANNEVIVCGDGFVASLGNLIPSCPKPVITTTLTSSPANCGNNNGSATVTAGNGLPPYTYSWSNGQTGSTANNLSSGIHTVTVTDATCLPLVKTSTVLVTSIGGPTVSISSQTNVNCNVSGSATAGVTGGTSPYTYSWSNGSATQTVNGLSGGTYTVTVRDNGGCYSATTITITNNSGLTANANVVSNVNCFGNNNGSALASATGGTGALTYSWSNGQAGANATGLAAGNYSVTITDANGCTGIASVQITQPTALSAGNITFSNITCNGGSNGTITVAPTGGTSPYTYNWSNGQTNANIIGLAAGLYSLTVTDARGCTTNAIYNFPQVPPVSSIATVKDNDCGQNNKGIISSLAGTGGTPGIFPTYTYLWSNGSTSTYLPNLSNGVYSVTITDANGCTGISTYSVGPGPNPAINASFTPTLSTVCLGSTITFTHTGSPATAYWWYLQDSNSVTLTIGYGTSWTYTFTQARKYIMNHTIYSNPCYGSLIDTFVVTSCPNPTVTVTNAGICKGSCVALSATGSGGTTPYTYSWSNGSTTQNISVCPTSNTNYTLVMTDASGGKDTAVATVTVFPVPSVTISPAHVSCNGGTNGSTTANISSGTFPYTYSWSNTQTTQTATGLASGNYSVTITDNNGCTTTGTVTITQPGAMTLTTSTSPAICTAAVGTASVSASGGTGAFTYSWNNGQSTTSISNLSSGTYTITVRDANGCTAVAPAIVSSTITAPTLTITPTNVSCYGGSSGSATVNVSGGFSPYTYSWSNGSTNPSASSLSSGTYSVTVTDNYGCSATSSIGITQPSQLVANAFLVNNVSCFGGNDGRADVNAAGGTSPYSYSWSNGATTKQASSLAAGTYTITVSDNNGCSSQSTITITEPPLLSVNTITNPAPCSGGGGGASSVNVTGGTPAYTYLWSNGSTSAAVSGLGAGTYTINVTDANSCVSSATISIPQPNSLLVNISVVNNISCNGGSNGAAAINVAGGITPYTYSWSNGSSTPSISNLTIGTYTATVTDSAGCSGTGTVTITEPTLLTSGIVSTDVTCFGANNGSATVNASGGTTPYTYTWSNTSTTQSAGALANGSYSVTVTDANGCTAIGSVNITEPPLLSTTVTVTNVSCFGQNSGSATVNVSGGVQPYNYLWSNNTSNAQANNLSAGTYTITVNDNNGCSATNTAIITEPSLLTATITAQTNITCNGGNNGSATVSASGGTAAYTYSWNTNPIQANTAATGLSAGSYSITVTDNNGCTATTNVAITEPTLLAVSVSSFTNVSCNGGNNGGITANVTGGTQAYTYSWNTVPSQSTTSATNLTAGNYVLTVTDANNCTASTSITITEPAALSLTLDSVAANCGQSNGWASVTVAGGTGGYQYSWNTVPVQTTSIAIGLSSNNYQVTVTDANNCSKTGSILVPNNAGVTAQIVSSFSVTCFGLCNGQAMVQANGGLAPYTYAWSGSTQTFNSIGGLCAGVYTASVTDANNCTSTATVSIGQPALLTISVTASANVSCNGGNNGSVTVLASGGSGVYTYAWNTVPVQNTATASGLTAGSYTATVTDANGCNAEIAVTITEPAALTSTITAQSNVSCYGGNNASAAVSAAGGSLTYTYSWNTVPAQLTTTATGLTAGSFTVTVTDNNGCTSQSVAVITEPALLTASVTSATNVSCNGNNDGSATVTVNGGTSSYNYSWSSVPVQSISTANNLAAGTYTVTVTDANNCTAQTFVTITQPNVLTAAISPPASICLGQNATITTNIQGGTPAYNYSWSSGQTTSSITESPLVSTGYTVTVTDNNGCTVVANTSVTVSQALLAQVSNPSVICQGGSVLLTANASGGNGNYTFTWLPQNQNGSGINVSPAATTSYSVIVNDNCSSPDTAEVTITVNPLPVVGFTADDTAGCVTLCVNFTNTTPNSTSYTWFFGDGTTSASSSPLHCYTSSGVYNVSLTVTDNNGCQATLVKNGYINVFDNPVAGFILSPSVTSILNGLVQFTDQSAGATSWAWTFGDVLNSFSSQRDPSFTYMDTGLFVITQIVTNQYGCSDTAENMVHILPDFAVYIPNAFTPDGDGLNEVFLPKGLGIDFDQYEFYVFDRWGNLIFETNDPLQGWDGRANGGVDIAQVDTYVWLLKAKDFTGLKYKYVGHVNLIR